MAKLAEDDAFAGAVLIAKDGEPLFKKAYGLASKSYQVPNQLDTKFNIASMGKMITGVAIAQLVEQGRLSFEDPLDRYLPEDWLRADVSEKIQIRHLLTHTSGLGDYFRKMRQHPSPMPFRGLEDYKPLVADVSLSFEPGTKWSYSNTGMLLLGVVIEQVTGESYFDYVRNHIYQPSGMVNTDAYEKDHPVPNRSIGYVKVYSNKEVEWISNQYYSRVVKGGPSGGSYSTVEDLLRFAVALQTHKLLSPDYTDLVLSPKPELTSPFYGYGFYVSQSEVGQIAEHGGDGTGIESSFRMYLDSGYVVAVLSNYGKPAASIVDKVIHQMIIAR
jgi:CubicO group peptidase (beta-lactamase class C family)